MCARKFSFKLTCTQKAEKFGFANLHTQKETLTVYSMYSIIVSESLCALSVWHSFMEGSYKQK